MSKERAEEIMSIYLTDVVGKGKIELIDGFTAVDYFDHTQPKQRGPAALKAHVEAFRANISNPEVEVVKISASENTAFGVWRWQGTPLDPIWGKSISGEVIVPRLIGSYFQLKNDELIEYQPFLDAMDVFRQLR